MDRQEMKSLFEGFMSDFKTTVRTELKEQLDTINTSVTSLREDVNRRQVAVETKVQKHDVQLKSIFKRDRNRNLVIFGWIGIEKTSIKEMREKVYNLLANNLQIQGCRSFDIEYVRAVGRNKKIVIATLCSAELVRQAIMNASKLKGSNVFLSYDSSPEERALKKRLINHKKNLTGKGKLCKVKNKTLIVNSVPYTLEQLDSGILDQGVNTLDVRMDEQSARQAKRQLSVSPEEEKNKKAKPCSPMLQDSNTSFHTDPEEFEETMSSGDEQKNGEAVPRQAGQE